LAKTPTLAWTLYALIGSFGGAVLSIALCGVLTLLLSLLVCFGLHPESVGAEWVAVVIALVWSGAIVRRVGVFASIGSGVIVGVLWAAAWLWLVSRWDGRFLTDAWAEISLGHVLSWLVAPLLTAVGGLLASRVRRSWIIHLAAPVVVVLAALVVSHSVDRPGHYEITDGVSLEVMPTEIDGTTVRFLTFDSLSKAKLHLGIYDRDSDDSQPFDDRNTSYFATPAATVFDRLGKDAVLVINAGFFTWTPGNRIASHVAPVVDGRKTHYNVSPGAGYWTIGWNYVGFRPRFYLERGVPYAELSGRYENALVHVRPLIVNGKALELRPGAGVTRLKCSRTSVAWSEDDGAFYVLVVRDPDGERASINKWRAKARQVGGWDLVQVQRFWKKLGVDQAVALDGGDSTQLVYRGSKGVEQVGSGRLSLTLGYLRDRPVRTWIPILPVRHSGAGVMNYLYVKARN
jgi:hypothetical protein